MLCSLPEISTIRIKPPYYVEPIVHTSFFAGLSASSRLVKQLHCLDVTTKSLSNDDVCALSRLTGLQKLRLECPAFSDTHVNLSPLCALPELQELSLPLTRNQAGDYTWLDGLTRLRKLHLNSFPSGPVQLPCSLQMLTLDWAEYKGLPRLMSAVCTDRLPGLECLTVLRLCEDESCLNQQYWHALSTALSQWSKQAQIIIETAYIDNDLKLFLVLCERAPLIGGGIQQIFPVEDIQQDTCLRLGVACPNIKSE